MDILSPAGQETVKQEQRAIDLWLTANPNWHYIETIKDQPAVMDAVLVKDGIIRAVVETKCRTMTYKKFAEYKFNAIMTFDKMMSIKLIAEKLCVPFIAFLYLVPDDLLLWKNIWSPETDWNTTISISRTKTQSSVNGGTAHRQNAFINFRDARMARGSNGSK